MQCEICCMTPHPLVRAGRPAILSAMKHVPPPAVESAARPHARISHLDARLRRVALISRVTDTAVRVPGTNVKLGLDAVIGAVPVAGDLVMAGASAVLILDAWKLGVPKAALGQMAINAALDATLGSVPFVGDLFDLVYRANERNLRIVEQHIGSPDAPLIDV